jgi:hypothetical protein
MTEDEKRYLFLILDHYLIYSKKTGQTILRSPTEDFEKALQEFITRVKNRADPEPKEGDVAQ